MRKLIAIAGVIAIAGISVSTVSSASTVRTVHHQRVVCQKLFTVKEAVAAGKRTWSRTKTPTARSMRHLRRYAVCQRNRAAVWYVKWQYHRSYLANKWRKFLAAHPYWSWHFPYGQWSINPRIVYCESSYQNLTPNSADASGYYQMLGSTWRSWAAAAGLTNYPPEAYEASLHDQGIAAWYGSRHDTDYSPWAASQGCWG